MENKIIKMMLAALCLILPAVKINAQEVTMQSLLREMVNREKQAEFPSGIPYRTLDSYFYFQYSSADTPPLKWFVKTWENSSHMISFIKIIYFIP